MEATPAPLSIGTIGQIAINVKDLERATAFYRDKVGLKFLFAAPGLAFFDAGGIRLMLGKAEKPELDHRSSMAELIDLRSKVSQPHSSLGTRRMPRSMLL